MAVPPPKGNNELADKTKKRPSGRPLMTSEEVAAYLRIEPGTLNEWAYRGTGPRYVKVGHLRRYRPGDVDAYLESRSSKQAGATPEGRS
jgi:excisionase family DNA binding protein